MRALFAIAFATLGAAAVVVACSDDPEGRPGFEQPDAGGQANLPETGTVTDAGTDAADAKDPYTSDDEQVVCDAGPCAVELVAGDNHFCARMADGTVRCWGDDTYGSLGRTTPDGGGVIDLEGATQISAGGETTCALADGDVSCWGGNKNGELAISIDDVPSWDWAPHPDPVAIPLGAPAKRVDVGHGSVCALLTNDDLVCWGKDDQHQLSRADEDPEIFPVLRKPGVAAIAPLAVTRVVTASHTSLAISPSGELWVWGALMGKEGLVGGRISSISPQPSPRRVLGLANVTQVAAAPTMIFDDPNPPWEQIWRAHACAIAAGEVYCWGKSEKGALCTGLPDPEKVPRHAPIWSKAWPQRLAVSDEITCARMTDGTIECCGSDDKQRLGVGEPVVLSSTFRRAYAFKGYAVQIAASLSSVCALVKDGTIECWGGNEHGELGLPADDAPHGTPVKVSP